MKYAVVMTSGGINVHTRFHDDPFMHSGINNINVIKSIQAF
jgi:hypothetical protein